MRLKLFFTPFAFFVAIIVIIWYIWPTAQQIMAKNDEIKKNNESLNSILDKKNNVEILRGVLDGAKEKENFVLNYLPYSRNDERVVDAINYIATDSGSSLIKLSVEEKASLAPMPTADAGLSAAPLLADGTVDPNAPVTIPKPSANFFTVKADISGKYENIKMFVEQAYIMNIFNKVTALAISKELSSSTDQSGADSGILLANVEFEFGYLPQIHEENGSSSEVFAKKDFDFSSYDKIVKSITKTIPALDEGQKGKSNPFIQ